MENIQELKIIVIGRRRVGKTSLLAATYEEFSKTFEQANIFAKADNTRTLNRIENCKNTLKHIDPRLKNYTKVNETPSVTNPWGQHDFVFDIGSKERTFLQLKFTDPSGEYFNLDVNKEAKEYVEQELRECDALIIPIDATALMQKKMGMVNSDEIGQWHDEFNAPDHITELIRNAYINLKVPRLIILAPIKCETYTQTKRDADNLLHHVRLGYQKLLEFLRSENLWDKVAVVVTPVETIGNVKFAYTTTDKDGFTKFEYHKTPINAPYQPKYGDQPIRYILLFLINLYLQNKRTTLPQLQEALEEYKDKVNKSKDELQQIEDDFRAKKERWEKRQNSWAIWRAIINIIDDKEAPYQEAKSKLNEHKEIVNKHENSFYSVEKQVNATQEEIEKFTHAIQKFAENCKGKDQDDYGFSIIQGRKWFRT